MQPDGTVVKATLHETQAGRKPMPLQG